MTELEMHQALQTFYRERMGEQRYVGECVSDTPYAHPDSHDGI